MRHALAQCNFPRPGSGCPMVGMKLISKPVDGLYSTAIYLLEEDNLPIQTSKRYHVFGEKLQLCMVFENGRPTKRPTK